MPTIRHNTFSGIAPRIAPRLLPANAAQVAENVDLSSGELEPINKPAAVPYSDTQDNLPNINQTAIYLWRYADTSKWLSWESVDGVSVDVIKGPVADDQYDRIYWTDGQTLHCKLWDAITDPANPVVVDQADVSRTAPNPPTITKQDIFDASVSVGATWKGATLSLTAREWDGDLLKLTFHVPSLDNSDSHPLRLTVAGYNKAGVPSPRSTPDSYDDLNPEHLYDTTIDLWRLIDTANPVKFGTFQVVNVEDINYIFAPTNDGWGPIFDKRVTIKMNLERSSTQYQVYVATWVDKYGQESPESDASQEIEWRPQDILTVTATAPAGADATKMRVYRSVAGTTETRYLMVKELSPTDAAIGFEDSYRDCDLSVLLPNIENPPERNASLGGGIQGIVLMACGIAVAFRGYDIYFSEPYLPYSWPIVYRQTLDYKIVGLCTIGNYVLATTEGQAYSGTGTHPSMITMNKVPLTNACVSKRGICATGNAMYYPSNEGYVMVQGMSAVVESLKFYTQEQWMALHPSTMVAGYHDGRIFLFPSSGSGLIFQVGNGLEMLTTTTVLAQAVYRDILSDTLYLVSSMTDYATPNQILAWKGGSDPMVLRWRGKDWKLSRPAEWTAGRVLADDYNATNKGMTISLWAEGKKVLTEQVIPDMEAFRIPHLRPERVWCFEIVSAQTTAGKIHEIIISGSMEALRHG